MSDIADLTRARANLKGSLTRLINFYQKIKSDPIDEYKFNQINERLSNATDLLDNFNRIQDEIDAYSFKNVSSDVDVPSYEEDILTKSLSEREAFEDKYYDIISLVKSYLNSYNPFQELNQAISNAPLVQDTQFNIKLPNLNLPIFTGKYNEWVNFNDTFKSLIDSNPALTTIQKFYYLKSCLKHEASDIIEFLEVTILNYPIAWQILRDRFENKKIIINNHIKQIVDLPPIRNGSHFELRNLSDTVNKNIRCLKALRQGLDHWDSLLIYIVSQKFDSHTKTEWEQYQAQDTLPTYENLMAFLKNHCSILESLSITTPDRDPHSITKIARVQKPIKNTAQSNSYFSSTNFKCIFCQNSHNIYNCPDYLKLSIQERINEAHKHKFCLRTNHLVKDCRSTGCRKCNRKHHTLLHIERLNKISSSEPPINSSNPSTSEVSNFETSSALSSYHYIEKHQLKTSSSSYCFG